MENLIPNELSHFSRLKYQFDSYCPTLVLYKMHANFITSSFSSFLGKKKTLMKNDADT